MCGPFVKVEIGERVDGAKGSEFVLLRGSRSGSERKLVSGFGPSRGRFCSKTWETKTGDQVVHLSVGDVNG